MSSETKCVKPERTKGLTYKDVMKVKKIFERNEREKYRKPYEPQDKDQVGIVGLGKIVAENVRTQKHYTQFVIQPMEFTGRNNLGFLEGNIIKYVCRYKLKNGLVDLQKAKHYLEKLIEREEKGTITL